MPRRYTAPLKTSSWDLDGRLDKPQWQDVPWTEEFVDILGLPGESIAPRFLERSTHPLGDISTVPAPHLRARAKIAYTPDELLIGATLDDPHLWATLTEHDSIIFLDNDFEVFIDPDGDHALYGELEINALNTTWDLLLDRTYLGGGAAIHSWEIKGLRTAVHLDGSLNDPSDEDRGWSVEIAIPWQSLVELSTQFKPVAGNYCRLNFSRVHWELDVVDGAYVKRPNRPENNWVWSPQRAIDMHRPWHWGVLCLGDADGQFPGQIDEHALQVQQILGEIAVRQKAALESSGDFDFACLAPGIALAATPGGFVASCDGWVIDQTFRVRPIG